MRRSGVVTLLALAFAAAPREAAPDAADDVVGRTTRRVVAGEKYRASGLHRLLFGRDYRDLWTLPVELPVLDLENFAGGLRPVKRVGHGQSKGLAMKGANGRSYTFRPVLKDPSGLLPVELRDTFARSVVQDQMASGHPAGHVVVPAILDAVGVLHNTPRLVVMPDQAALGEFREDFRGLVGDLEEFGGDPGFTGAEEVIDGEEMWKRLRESPDVRADSRAYLTARLVDHLIGDWDRHRNQWRWAKLPGKTLWQPIPEDRDQAFVRFEGLAIMLIRPQLPLLVDFGPDYPSLDGLTFDGWDVDRRLLADLEKPAWDEVAAAVKSRITDAVIEGAVRRMPAAYLEKDGPRLIAALERRRDHLREQADRFYRFLTGEVDVFGTDRPEIVDLVRSPNGDLEVSVAVVPGGGGAPPAPYFHRQLHPAETHEVRLYLFGGDDRVVVRGRGPITVRVVGGDGSDVLDDSRGGGTRFADSSGGDRVIEGPGTTWDRDPYTAPPNPSADWIPPRDWGRRTLSVFRITGGPDLGVFLSAGITTTGHGFRKDPYSDHQTVRAGYATRAETFRGEYNGEFRFENSSLRANLHARASGFDMLRFFGFGNQTTSTGPDAFYKVEQDQFTLEPSLAVPVGPRFDLSFGPVVKLVVTNHVETKFIGTVEPYGVGTFSELGASGGMVLNTTDRPGLPRRGVVLSAGGAFYPGVFDVKTAFGEVHGDASTYLSGGTALRPTLVLRTGGKRVWGTYPFFESAFIGGGTALSSGPTQGGNSAVRGLRSQRYAGDASLYGSAELRLSLTRAFLLVPGEIGVFGLADVGRVYLEGESSDKWHSGAGGGVFFASPNRRNAVSLAVARAEGRTGVYLRAGFGF